MVQALGVATADCNLSSRDYALVNSWVWEFDERLLFGDGKRVDAPRTKARHYGKPPDRRSRVRCVVNMDEVPLSSAMRSIICDHWCCSQCWS